MRIPGMRLLMATTFVGFAGFSLLLSLSPLWALEGGADEFSSGMVTTVLMFVTVATQLNVNRLLAAVGWTRIFALGLVMLGAPALVQAIAPDAWLVLLTTAARGVGFGIITVCGATATSLLAPPEIRGRAIGVYGLAIAVPQVALMTAAPWLAETFGLQLAIILGVIPIIGLAWAAPLGREIARHDPQFTPGRPPTEAELGAAAGSGASSHDTDVDGSSDAGDPAHPTGRERASKLIVHIWMPVLTLVLITASGGAFLTFAPQLAPGTGAAVAVLFTMTVVAAVARWGIGSLLDRWGSRPFIWSLLVAGAVGLGAIAFGLSPLAAGALTPTALIIGSCLLGLAYGGLQTATLVRAFSDGGERRRHRTSVAWNVGFDVGTGLGSMLIGGIALAASFSAAFAVMCAITALAAIAVVIREAWTLRR